MRAAPGQQVLAVLLRPRGHEPAEETAVVGLGRARRVPDVLRPPGRPESIHGPLSFRTTPRPSTAGGQAAGPPGPASVSKPCRHPPLRLRGNFYDSTTLNPCRGPL